MFLASTYHEMASQTGRNVPYTAMALYRLTHWRDKRPFGSRVVAEIAYVPLTVFATAESVARFVLFFPTLFFTPEPHLWAEGILYSIVTIYSCLFALMYNLFVQNLAFKISEFDINLRSHQKNTLLLHAAHAGKEKLIDTLLKMGASPHDTRPHDGLNATLCVKLMGHTDLQKKLPPTIYEKQYVKLKTLTHWLSLKGKLQLGDQEVNFEGTLSPWMFHSIHKTFEAFQKWNYFNFVGFPKDKCKIFEDIFNSAYHEHDYNAIAHRIRARLATALDAAWKGHALCVAYADEYIAISNRGENNPRYGPLEIFKIDPEKVTAEIVKAMLSYKQSSAEKGQKFFYEILPAALSSSGKVEKDAFCQEMTKAALNLAESGNCTLSSKLGTVPFFFAFMLEDHPTKASIAEARRLACLFSDFGAIHQAEKIDPRKEFADCSGWEVLAAKVDRKVAKYRNRLWGNLSYGGRFVNLFG